jgi:hypothetical protein
MRLGRERDQIVAMFDRSRAKEAPAHSILNELKNLSSKATDPHLLESLEEKEADEGKQKCPHFDRNLMPQHRQSEDFLLPSGSCIFVPFDSSVESWDENPLILNLEDCQILSPLAGHELVILSKIREKLRP